VLEWFRVAAEGRRGDVGTAAKVAEPARSS